MEKYKNLGGDSPIRAYQIADTSIEVQFGDATYLYDYDVTGKQHVERMKQLAAAGLGLATYISRTVKQRYLSKRPC